MQPEQQDLLIAHLSEAGFEGFEQNDEELKAFIPAGNYDRELIREMAFKYQLGYSEEWIPEQNWNRVWESEFHPVVVDDFVGVRADFHEPLKGVEMEIIITPKMSFGTGHHATTTLMIREMRGLDFSGKRVLDFGTGTGILAILAEKLGAEQVLAIDHDDWSIANAAENLEQNNCGKTVLRKTDRVEGDGSFDIILANINRNVIVENFSALFNHLSPGGSLLISGLLSSDENEIQLLAATYQLKISSKNGLNDWICLRFNH